MLDAFDYIGIELLNHGGLRMVGLRAQVGCVNAEKKKFVVLFEIV